MSEYPCGFEIIVVVTRLHFNYLQNISHIPQYFIAIVCSSSTLPSVYFIQYHFNVRQLGSSMTQQLIFCVEPHG